MRILFVHQNFPGQFKYLVPAMVARGDEATAMCMTDAATTAGVRIVRSVGRCGTGDGHPWSRDFDTKVIRGEATLTSAIGLAAESYAPDVIVAHPGWGESLFLKEVWPAAKLVHYCEYFYAAEGGDGGFDPEFASDLPPAAERARLWLRNLPQRVLFDQVDAGLSPTRFQASTYPRPFADRISVIHDGIDTDAVRPGLAQPIRIASSAVLTPGDEIITFVSRNLEPYRGYHRLMRALPGLLARRPNAHVVIVGGDGRGYGTVPPAGSWKQIFLDEVADDIDLARVHFVGKIAYPAYLNLLRISRLHIYLTYPFVASWSLLEAMASGAPILASDTAPVAEFVTHGETGMLFDFFDTEALIDGACAILDDPALAAWLSGNARASIVAHQDLRTVCLPRQIAFLDAVRGG